jgi:DNA invertase Pin-like site-specific DNA recombinase
MTSTPASIPWPRLADVAPELVVELQRLLVQQVESALVDQVAELGLLDRCRCGDSFCASFCMAPRPNGPFGSGHRTIPLWSDSGMLKVDVVGARIVHVEVDRPTTVRRGLERRPGEAALLDAIRSSTIDKVLILGIDRVGRTLIELVNFLETCRTAEVSLWLDEQQIDTATDNGMSLFGLGTMMAFHLRQRRRDRILRGQAAARSLKIRFGRPALGQAQVDKAKVALAAGKGVRQAARMAGISAASASRLRASMGSAAACV